MSKQFESIIQGLNEAIEYAKGDTTKGVSRKRTIVSVEPITDYSKDDIKAIRTQYDMTQRTFAELLGVSPKAVEAWELGTRKPTGTAKRLFQLIEQDHTIIDKIIFR